MIAKHIMAQKQTSSAAGLIRYIINAKGDLDPRGWQQTTDYILDVHTADANAYGEKVGGVRVTNCNTDDPVQATMAIHRTQLRNARSKNDKTYHLVFSFPPGEEPPLEVLHAIEDELCASIGYADHQRISAVHIDKEHLHVHVAINKVHPTGFRNVETFRDRPRLMEASERLEIKYGLERNYHGLDKGIDNHERRREHGNDELRLGPEQSPHLRDSRFRRYLSQSYNIEIGERPEAETLNGLRNLSSCHMARASEGTPVLLPGDARSGVEPSGEESADGLRRSRDGARTDAGATKTGLSARICDIEQMSLQETLAGYVARELGDSFRAAQSWSELHEKAGAHGLSFKLRGAGLVIGDETLGLWTKASSVDRNLSLTALSKKLGAFEAGGKGENQDKSPLSVSPDPQKPRYQPKPLSKAPASASLYARYQWERAAMNVSRRNGFAAIRAESEQLKHKLNHWKATQRMVAKVSMRGQTKKLALATIRMQSETALKANAQTLAARRHQLFNDTAMLSWADWLLVQARKGNADALAILQERQRQEVQRTELLTGTNPEMARQMVRLDLKPRVDSRGNVTYRASDGGLVVDSGKQVHAKSNSINAALMALEIASKKFDGHPLIVKGSEQFRRDVALMAAKYNYAVQFADPELEQLRVRNAKPDEEVQRAEIAANEPSAAPTVSANIAEEEKAAGPSALEKFLQSRNEQRESVYTILPHRQWTPQDAGRFAYAGRRELEDKTEVLLFEREGEMLVKPSPSRVVAKASKWKIGQSGEIDALGRIAGLERAASRAIDE